MNFWLIATILGCLQLSAQGFSYAPSWSRSYRADPYAPVYVEGGTHNAPEPVSFTRYNDGYRAPLRYNDYNRYNSYGSYGSYGPYSSGYRSPYSYNNAYRGGYGGYSGYSPYYGAGAGRSYWDSDRSYYGYGRPTGGTMNSWGSSYYNDYARPSYGGGYYDRYRYNGYGNGYGRGYGYGTGSYGYGRGYGGYGYGGVGSYFGDYDNAYGDYGRYPRMTGGGGSYARRVNSGKDFSFGRGYYGSYYNDNRYY